MLSRFGIEASQAAQYVIAFVIILVLVALFGLVLRRLTGGRLMLPGQDRGRARQPRLGIVDIYDLDRQRQLILLRRDNVEHLLLIGGPNDVVIETNIVRVAGARLPAAAADGPADRSEPTFERATEPARPQIEQNGRPSIEAQLAARLGSFVGRPGDKVDADEAFADATAPARVEPVLKPSAVTLATPPAPPSPASPTVAQPPVPPPSPPPTPLRAPLGGRPDSAAPPVRPVSPATQSRPASEPPFRTAPRPEPRPVATPPAPPPSPPARPAPPPERNADAAVLSVMAKQLEEALRRPQATPAPTPNRVLPALDTPRRDDEDLVIPPARPVQPPPAPRPEPVRSEPPRPEPARLEPVRPEPVRTDPLPPRTEPRPAPTPASSPAPVRPAPPSPSPPAPPRAAPPPPPPPPAPPAPPAQARPIDDPFSVDEIEAEFARLLGRPGGNGKT